MTISSEAREQVSRRVAVTCAMNQQQVNQEGDHIINMRACVELAFVLGIRFGMKHHDMAGEYMQRWISDRVIETDPMEMARRHELAMEACVELLWNEGY